MQLKQLLTSLLLLGSIYSVGQKPYYNQTSQFLKANSKWVFGNRESGLDLSKNPAVEIASKINVRAGSSSVADPQTGELLFYTDGKSCWNNDNNVMPNGDNLLGSQGATAQGTCIVPVPESPGKYYLFSLSAPNEALSPRGTLFYSVVDMNLDGGKGDIEKNRKNIPISSDTLSQSMVAIPGDDCDLWLLIHDYEKPVFKAYHITKSGIRHHASYFKNRRCYPGSVCISTWTTKCIIRSYYDCHRYLFQGGTNSEIQ